jgi:hypothetical protein
MDKQVGLVSIQGDLRRTIQKNSFSKKEEEFCENSYLDCCILGHSAIAAAPQPLRRSPTP